MRDRGFESWTADIKKKRIERRNLCSDVRKNTLKHTKINFFSLNDHNKDVKRSVSCDSFGYFEVRIRLHLLRDIPLPISQVQILSTLAVWRQRDVPNVRFKGSRITLPALELTA